MSDYTMPLEIKSATKIGRHITFVDVVIVFVYFLIFDTFTEYIHPLMVPVYYVVNVLIPLILTRPSPVNRNKKIFHTLIFGLVRDRNVYHYIYRENEK